MQLTSCKLFNKDSYRESGEIIARVHNNYLYSSEIENVTSGMNKEDSTKLSDSYLQNWIKEMLFLSTAEKNLNTDNIDKKVNDYRKSLILAEYKNSLADQKVDRNIDLVNLQATYERFQEELILDHDLINIEFAVFEFKNDNTSKFIKELNNNYEEYIGTAIQYCNEKATKFFLNETLWVDPNKFLVEWQKPTSLNLTKNKLFKLKTLNNGFYLIFRVNEVVKAKSTAPIEYVEDKLNEIILFERKQKLIDELMEKNFQNAKNTEAYEIY